MKGGGLHNNNDRSKINPHSMFSSTIIRVAMRAPCRLLHASLRPRRPPLPVLAAARRRLPTCLPAPLIGDSRRHRERLAPITGGARSRGAASEPHGRFCAASSGLAVVPATHHECARSRGEACEPWAPASAARWAWSKLPQGGGTSAMGAFPGSRLKIQPLWGIVPHFSVPDTAPGIYPEYPGPLRGCLLSVAGLLPPR